MEIVELKQITAAFTDELRLSAQGKQTSLPFVVNQLSTSPLAREKELFQVLKIGGSIGQNALVVKTGGKIVIKQIDEERLPVFSTGKALLAFIKSNLRKNLNYLAINFAFPIKPIWENNRLDGIILNNSKEHALVGLVGKQLGVMIEKFIWEKFHRRIFVTVANDTVCLALSGLTQFNHEGLAGGVVGTGMNFAVFLKSDQVVNLEAAFFNRFKPSPEGKIIDFQSTSPGLAVYEKEVSGGYLFQHYNLKKDNKFSKIISTHYLDKIARGEKPGDKDLARKLFQRAAQLCACQVAGIARFKKRPMVFVMEGSLFWVGWNFRKTVAETVKLLAPDYPVTFKAIKDCGIIGAAKLVA